MFETPPTAHRSRDPAHTHTHTHKHTCTLDNDVLDPDSMDMSNRNFAINIRTKRIAILTYSPCGYRIGVCAPTTLPYILPVNAQSNAETATTLRLEHSA